MTTSGTSSDPPPAPSPAAAERAALLDLLADVGPAAPTLAEGWTTHDLSAHLVARERRPLALPGLVVPALHGLTAREEQRMRRVPYEDLLARLRSGPPPWSPAGALRGPLDGLTDLHEMFVHAEDVRRPRTPQPRALPAATEDALWSRVRVLGPLLTARAGRLGIRVATPDGRAATVRPGRDAVELRGTPGELLLWLFGRRAAAHVEVSGSPEAVARAASARLGV